MSIFHLPDLGEGLQEAEIVSWHVAEGDHVIADQPLVSVETEKAVVEIPAPYSGTVKKLIAGIGEAVPTGGALAEISTKQARDKGAIVGEIEPADKLRKRPAPVPDRPSAKTQDEGTKASPAVRKLARERGIDLSGIVGSGPEGTILSSDVMTTAGSVLGEQLRGVRRSMARAMTASHASVVPATVMDHAVIDQWREDEAPTVRLIHAITVACRAEPALNAWFDGDRRQMHDHIDLAIAVDSDDGLFTPVLRHADTETDIISKLASLEASVRDRSIKPDAMKGATITLSNFGMIGGEYAVLVVTPPQVAILGAGRISSLIGKVDGKPVQQRVLPLSLSFDHRIVTGGEAARFLNAVRADLELESIDNGGG